MQQVKHTIGTDAPKDEKKHAAFEDTSCDVLVIGSGAAGLSAAITGAIKGLDVIVAEKEPVFGGTTAFSGGWLWIPHTPHARRAGYNEDPELPKTYLRAIMAERYDETLIDSYLTLAPQVIDFFEKNTQVQFNPGATVPDFFGNIQGAAKGWRSIVAAPYDGRKLGPLIKHLRKPIPETTLCGMGIASGADMRAFLTVFRSLNSCFYVSKRLLRHGWDLLTRQRSMQIVNGNALVARLLKSAADCHVTLWHSAPAQKLIFENDRVHGAFINREGRSIRVHARFGVILATGGFPHDQERMKQLFAHVREGTSHHSAAPLSNTGDGLRLGESVGGRVDTTLPAAGAWAPVSLVPRKDGTTTRFPHLVERGKPGLIAVRKNGKRFIGEDCAYHAFVEGMLKATPRGEQVRCWLIADHRFIRRYGLGAVKPFPLPLRPWLKNGYLKRGRTWDELARKCGIDSAALRTTIARYNENAKHGEDHEFGRGTTPYQRIQGDPDHQPNPCNAPLVKPPFYAIEIAPGSLGTFAGIITDAQTRVLDGDKCPIPGLYAAGNDMNSIMGGHYPSGGITLGPAMTFGFVAANEIAAQKIADDASVAAHLRGGKTNVAVR